MKISIIVLAIAFGISFATSSDKYKNPNPFIDDVWGPAFTAEIQEKVKSMEWEHNKRLRNFTQQMDKLFENASEHSKIYNFTAAHILAPYERYNLSGFKIEHNGITFEFGPMDTEGFKYLGPPYMIADYDNLKANLTLPTMREIHLKGKFTYTVNGGSRSKPIEADIYTEQGGTGTTFIAMISMLKKVNGHYHEDLQNNPPRCVFEYENLNHTYDKIEDSNVLEAMESDNHYVERRLFQLLADNFCVAYMTHIQEKIDYIYEWNSPIYQMRSAFGQGMYDIVSQYLHQMTGEASTGVFDVGQGYTIKQCCGYDVEFIESKVSTKEKSFHLLDPTTHQMGSKATVDITLMSTDKASVDFKIILKNETQNYTVQQSVVIIPPLKFLLTFVKDLQNKHESIHLAAHPDSVVAGIYDVITFESVDPNIQRVLKSLNPYYRDAFNAAVIGFSQYHLFKYLYPGYIID